MADNSNKPERPRVEPEIIPPNRGGGPDDRFGGRTPNWPPQPPFGYAAHGPQRVFVGRIGPLGIALLLLAMSLFGAVFLFVLIGTALIWIPVAAVLLVVAGVVGLFRRL